MTGVEDATVTDAAAAAATDVVALRAFVDELVRAGLHAVVVCPGSRSTPLALALRMHPGMQVRVLPDERAAGFFALGLARASRRATGVLVTSGTAAANLLPAAVEATLGRVPLVLLTADRPPELRDRGAPQAIDQGRLFGVHVKWDVELPLLDGTPETRRHVRSLAGRAVATACAGPAGAVHLNVPFREPLVPAGDLRPHASAVDEPRRPFTDVVTGPRTLAPSAIADLAQRLAGARCGLIVAGPQDDPGLPAALARLAHATGFPILADPLSGARCGPHDRSHVIARGDLLCRPGPWRDAHLPDLVIRFGASPTSKPLLALVADAAPDQLVVDGDGGYREPALLPTTFVHADARVTADALADEIAREAGTRAPSGIRDSFAAPEAAGFAGGSAWRDGWLAADRAADAALRAWLAGVESRGEAFEGAPFAHLGELLPDGAILWAGSSMPVRDLDAWLPAGGRAIRPLANRGANGIDGVVSSALGAAAAGAGHVVLVVGDLSFLHDLNALAAAKRHGLTATIVLVDNDGGGIFSFLPQARDDTPGSGLPEHYEELFGTPHGIDFGPVVEALGATYRPVGVRGLRTALAERLVATGVGVLQLRTERARNVELHAEAAAAVAAALAAAGK
jgi:2-succinyl-5-enolpyruvyl-6-hydroxy-3-cyclohexene-1-carboxylate synthase